MSQGSITVYLPDGTTRTTSASNSSTVKDLLRPLLQKTQFASSDEHVFVVTSRSDPEGKRLQDDDRPLMLQHSWGTGNPSRSRIRLVNPRDYVRVLIRGIPEAGPDDTPYGIYSSLNQSAEVLCDLVASDLGLAKRRKYVLLDVFGGMEERQLQRDQKPLSIALSLSEKLGLGASEFHFVFTVSQSSWISKSLGRLVGTNTANPAPSNLDVGSPTIQVGAPTLPVESPTTTALAAMTGVPAGIDLNAAMPELSELDQQFLRLLDEINIVDPKLREHMMSQEPRRKWVIIMQNRPEWTARDRGITSGASAPGLPSGPQAGAAPAATRIDRDKSPTHYIDMLGNRNIQLREIASLRVQLNCATATWMSEFLELNGIGSLESLMERIQKRIIAQSSAAGRRVCSETDSDLQLEGLRCVRTLMNIDSARSDILNRPAVVLAIATCLDAENERLAILACELLAGICMLPAASAEADALSGHALVLDALTELPSRIGEPYRFQRLVEIVGSSRQESNELRTIAMSLINAVVNCPTELAQRLRLRDELSRRGLMNVLRIAQLDATSDLRQQILLYMEESESDQLDGVTNGISASSLNDTAGKTSESMNTTLSAAQELCQLGRSNPSIEVHLLTILRTLTTLAKQTPQTTATLGSAAASAAVLANKAMAQSAASLSWSILELLSQYLSQQSPDTNLAAPDAWYKLWSSFLNITEAVLRIPIPETMRPDYRQKVEKSAVEAIAALDAANNQISRLNSAIESFDNELASRDSELAIRNQDLALRTHELAMRDQEIINRDQEIARLQGVVEAQAVEIAAKPVATVAAPAVAAGPCAKCAEGVPVPAAPAPIYILQPGMDVPAGANVVSLPPGVELPTRTVVVAAADVPAAGAGAGAVGAGSSGSIASSGGMSASQLPPPPGASPTTSRLSVATDGSLPSPIGGSGSPLPPASPSAAGAGGPPPCPPPPGSAGGPPPPPPLPGMGGPPPPPPPPGGPGGPPPPPPPPGMGAGPALPPKRTIKPNVPMRQMNWAKLPANKIKDSIWSDINDEKVSVDINVLESFFQRDAPAASTKTRLQGLDDVADAPTKPNSITLIDFNRANNLAILLSRFKMSNFDIKTAVLKMDEEKLSIEQLRALRQFTPTTEEVALVREYDGDLALLGPAERYFREMISISNLETRLDAMILKRQFDKLMLDLTPEVESINKANNELLKSKVFKELLQHVLAIGNYMNGSSFRGGAYGFRIDSIIKFAETKATPNAPFPTLLHYLAHYFDKIDESFVDFSDTMPNLEPASQTSLSGLQAQVAELRQNISRVEKMLEQMSRVSMVAGGGSDDAFASVMSAFIRSASPQVAELTRLLEESAAGFKNVLKKFAEEELNQPEDFFRVIVSFSQALRRARKENQEQEAQKEADARRAANAANALAASAIARRNKAAGSAEGGAGASAGLPAVGGLAPPPPLGPGGLKPLAPMSLSGVRAGASPASPGLVPNASGSDAVGGSASKDSEFDNMLRGLRGGGSAFRRHRQSVMIPQSPQTPQAPQT
ncbi:hypothetical protein H696_04048 [Fonticula alba]|uniref:FH2 domain-containing protein n=1 Tax=Fonticula alba TaxID=691883 RepID=A0A058Z5T8_FONAL|nr:hypothetical protein H696_04048 [Fonticula alba]KCV69630.1 hypothetical protein H696_04048 [Fonticula alba]|eukprot:XP_009496195.1 hypothetical protein H696_04048 [Fonticula alba]